MIRIFHQRLIYLTDYSSLPFQFFASGLKEYQAFQSSDRIHHFCCIAVLQWPALKILNSRQWLCDLSNDGIQILMYLYHFSNFAQVKPFMHSIPSFLFINLATHKCIKELTWCVLK